MHVKCELFDLCEKTVEVVEVSPINALHSE